MLFKAEELSLDLLERVLLRLGVSWDGHDARGPQPATQSRHRARRL
jgi:hypothetical protein